jgi:hypothetical protein
MNLTLGQASKQCGKSKSTILNAIQKGWISAEKNAQGQWQITPDELLRVYSVKKKPNDTQPNQNIVEIELYKQQIADLKQQVLDWKAESEKWSKQAQQLSITNRPQGSFFSFLKKGS